MLIRQINLHTTDVFYQSFRFGAEIAYVGATILKVCKKVEKILVGGKQKGKYHKWVALLIQPRFPKKVAPLCKM